MRPKILAPLYLTTKKGTKFKLSMLKQKAALEANITPAAG
jgi:hypothetical protein